MIAAPGKRSEANVEHSGDETFHLKLAAQPLVNHFLETPQDPSPVPAGRRG
jgi:hypothetical protein